MSVEQRLRELLLPVFGLDGIDEILPEASLVRDIGADSLDFVEITYLIEQEFGVVLKTSELLALGSGGDAESYFVEGRLTEAGAAILNQQFDGEAARFAAGMTKIALFESITVHDLAGIIESKREGAPC